MLTYSSLKIKHKNRGWRITNNTRDMLGGYPKNSDNYPNTSGVLNTFKYTVRAQRDSDALRK
jgi:hypothetical protein